MRTIALRVFLVAIFTPGLLAAVGAIVDRVIFGERNDPHFHVQYLAFSGLVAAPTVLARWTYFNGKRVKSLDFVIYVLQTVAFAIAYPKVLLAGEEAYYAVEHTNEVLSVDGQFNRIRTTEQAYDWLEAVMTKIFNNSLPGQKGSRQVSGRMFLLGSPRIKVNRAKIERCQDTLTIRLGLAGLEEGCYTKFSRQTELKEPYSPLNFTYSDLSYAGYNSINQVSDIITQTRFGEYPLSGYWTFIPLDCTVEDIIGQIYAMRRARWIDPHTRFVSLQAAVLIPDMRPAIWGVVEYGIDITLSGQLQPNPPHLAFNYMPSSPIIPGPASSGGAMKSLNAALRIFGEEVLERARNETIASGRTLPQRAFMPGESASDPCIVIIGREFFVPFYLAMFSTVVYVSWVHCLMLKQNWRLYLKRLFTYAEVLWIVMMVISLVTRLIGTTKIPCHLTLIAQQPFASANTSEEVVRTSIALRLEMQGIGFYWQDARYFLGLAFFLHLFIFLKFLVDFSKLGTLVRTLEAAGIELASFSISFLVIFMAFVVMFYTLFGLQVTEFSSFLRSVSSLWLGMLGELEITDRMWRRKEWAVPMIIVFTFISVFVLLTLIVAIISNAHERIMMEDDSRLLREQRLPKLIFSAWQTWKRRGRVEPSVEETSEGKEDLRKLEPFRLKILAWKQRAVEGVRTGKNANRDALLGICGDSEKATSV